MDDLFLPFDFSDQYLGCLRLSKGKSGYNLSYGVFDGIRAAYPSYCRPFISSKDGGNFIETFSIIEANREELLLDIEKSIHKLSLLLNE